MQLLKQRKRDERQKDNRETNKMIIVSETSTSVEENVGVQMALAEQGSDKSGSRSKNDQLKVNFVTDELASTLNSSDIMDDAASLKISSFKKWIEETQIRRSRYL